MCIWFSFYSFQSFGKIFDIELYVLDYVNQLILKSVHDNWVPELIINIILLSVVFHNLFCQTVLAHCISSYFCYYNFFTTFNFKIIVHIGRSCKNAVLLYTLYWASPNVNILHKHSTFLTSNISTFLFIILLANLVKQINKMIGPTLSSSTNSILVYFWNKISKHDFN